MPNAIATEGLSKRFGDFEAISGINLRVPENAVYGFLGPNGSGKTTAMRLVLGLLRPDAGRIELFGQDIEAHRMELLLRFGAFIESPALYDHLSGRANLEITCRLLDLPRSEVARVLDIVSMSRDADRKVREYSLGMRQRTALARTLLGEPRLLVLDEPTNGLDPEGIAEMRELIRSLPGRIGCTVLVSSHLLSEVEQVADYAGFLRKGRLVMEGRLTDLLAGGQRLQIVVDDNQRALGLLAREGLQDLAMDKAMGAIELKAPDTMPIETFAALINRQLVAGGLDVSVLQPKRRTLESLYDTAANSGITGEAA